MDDPLGALVAELDEIIDDCRRRHCRTGYFAALYRGVTADVRRQVLAGSFTDSDRMAAFTTAFAQRYLDAHRAWRAGHPTTGSWAVAFAAAPRWRPLVVQHLLLGMNAHINFDLGVVAAGQADEYGLAAVEPDFHHINAILSSRLDGSEAAVGAVSPWFGLLERLGGRTGTDLVRFSLVRAREAAWHTAERLSRLDGQSRVDAVSQLDRDVAGLRHLVLGGPPWARLATLIVRIRERRPVAEVIAALGAID